jgi:hypothetical protein
MVTMTAGMPLEVVMRRMQVQGSPGYPVQYASALDCVRQMYAREGLSSFWRRALPSLPALMLGRGACMHDGRVAYGRNACMHACMMQHSNMQA